MMDGMDKKDEMYKTDETDRMEWTDGMNGIDWTEWMTVSYMTIRPAHTTNDNWCDEQNNHLLLICPENKESSVWPLLSCS